MATAPTNEVARGVRGERVPPHDLDAEMALLGSLMMSRDAVAEVIPVIASSSCCSISTTTPPRPST